jgi:hypothetical protein
MSGGLLWVAKIVADDGVIKSFTHVYAAASVKPLDLAGLLQGRRSGLALMESNERWHNNVLLLGLERRGTHYCHIGSSTIQQRMKMGVS